MTVAKTRTYYVSKLAGPKVAGVRVGRGEALELTEHQARGELSSGALVTDEALVDDPWGEAERAAAEKVAADAKARADQAAADAKAASDKATADKASADAKSAADAKTAADALSAADAKANPPKPTAGLGLPGTGTGLGPS